MAVMTSRCPMMVAAVTAGAVIGLTACGSGKETPSTSRSMAERDSAGIRIVESPAPAWGADQGWRVAPVPEVVIGASSNPMDDRDTIPLYRVLGARFLPDGRIVAANAGTSEVLIFDGTGALLRRFGGSGDGPGELRRIDAVHLCGGDSIAVVDGSRLHLFDSEGTFLRRAQFRLGERSMPVHGVSTDCRRGMLQQRTRMPAVDRQGLTEDVFAWVDAVSETVDTVTTAELLEVWTRSFDGGSRPWVIPWGTSGRTHVTRDDQLVVGNGRAPEFRRYDSGDGLQLIVRWAGQPQPISADDRRGYAERRMEFLAGAPPNEPETGVLFPALDEYPEVPTHKPFFDRLLLDDRGGTWARVFPEGSLGLFDTRLPGPIVFTEPGRCSTLSASGWAISPCRIGSSSTTLTGIGCSAWPGCSRYRNRSGIPDRRDGIGSGSCRRCEMTRKWFGLLIVAGMAVYSLVVLPSLPAEIPIHWNLAGEPDGTMSKALGAFLLVFVGTGVWLLFVGLPHIDRRRRRDAEFQKSYWLLCNLLLLFLAAAHVLVLGLGLGWDVDPMQAMLIGMGLLFAGIGPILPRLSPNRWTGIRTPWTLSNDTVWHRTHRLGGYACAFAGLVMVAVGFLPHPARLWASALVFLAMVTVPVVYSYLVWRDLGENQLRG